MSPIAAAVWFMRPTNGPRRQQTYSARATAASLPEGMSSPVSRSRTAQRLAGLQPHGAAAGHGGVRRHLSPYRSTAAAEDQQGGHDLGGAGRRQRLVLVQRIEHLIGVHIGQQAGGRADAGLSQRLHGWTCSGYRRSGG